MTPEQLRGSILQAAIQGKLVFQSNTDSNVDDALAKMRNERERLISEGRLKKEGKINKKADTEIDIPSTWRLVPLRELVCKRVDNRGKTPQHSLIKNTDECIDLLEIASIDPGKSIDHSKVEKYVTEETYNQQRGFVEKDDILIATVGSIGKFALMDDTKSAVAQNIIAIKCFDIVDQRYVFYLLQSPYFYTAMGCIKMEAVQASIKVPDLMNVNVPLPPIEEQHRIVAKIEELLLYVDRYAESYEKMEQFNAKFPEDMKKSILQYAIQGKLVEQRPEEGTAEDLYQQIQGEKQRLIKEGKMKKEKPLAEISEDEIPFDIPDTWKWDRLGNLLVIERGGSPRPIKEFITTDDNGINWIKIGDTEKGSKYINSCAEKIIPEGMKKSRYVEKGDFILSNSMSFGRPYILNIDGCIHDGWLVLRQPVQAFDNDYLYYLLSSPMVFYQFCGRVAGAVVNNLNSDKVALTVIPIPPIEEQKRIAKKIEEMLPYCNQLIKE